MKQLTEQNFKPLPISLEHGRLTGLLPGPHRDPVDGHRCTLDPTYVFTASSPPP
jgi:PIN domain nuclease of toxin-antitoxin system